MSSGLFSISDGALKSLPKGDPARVLSILFMFSSLGNMVLCLGLVLLIQHPLAYGACALLYAAAVWTELRYGIRSPVSISLLLLYAVLMILDGYTDQFKGYAGVILFSWLSFLVGLLLILKKPFTGFYSKGEGLRQLHYAVSIAWFACYGACLLASTLLVPHVTFLILPPVLCIACGLLAIFLHFFWFGQANSLQREFKLGEFRFRRVQPDTPDVERFSAFYASQIYRPGHDGNSRCESEIADIVSRAERRLGRDAWIFIAEHDTRIVGCIRCVLDRRGRPFPLEEDRQISLDPLRRRGKILHVGRLAVDPAYRERPDVMSGLFKCFVDLALSKGIDFVVAEGLSHRLPTYMKLGFEVLFDRADPRHAVRLSHGYVAHPVWLNFSSLIFSRSGSAVRKFEFSDRVNQYLLERWFKRNVLVQIFRSPASWPWRLEVRHIRSLLT